MRTRELLLISVCIFFFLFQVPTDLLFLSSDALYVYGLRRNRCKYYFCIVSSKGNCDCWTILARPA